MRTGFRRRSTHMVRSARSRLRTDACALSNQKPNNNWRDSCLAAFLLKTGPPRIKCGAGFFRKMLRSAQTDGLNIVAVRIDQESGVVVGAVIGSQAWSPVVAPASFEAVGMEAINRGPIHCLKRYVHTETGRSLAGVE